MNKLALCRGCDNDFYNGNNKRCWMLDDAKQVTRYKIGWWTSPLETGAFTEVKTLNCHTESGRFGFYPKLPDCAGGVRRDP